MKKFMLVPTLLLSVTIAQASTLRADQVIGSFHVEEIKPLPVPNGGFVGGQTPPPGTPNGGFTGGTPGQTNPGPIPTPLPIPGQIPGQTPGSTYIPGTSSTGKVGEVITAARDIVALGEAVYELVKKGKPKVQTDYSPIVVLPRDPVSREVIDPMDLEFAQNPVERRFLAKVKNGSGVEVVKFEYKVVYSYGAQYNGTGKYLASVLIVPVSIKATHGWEFNSTAKLSSIMNHGSRANPVAGAMITIKYNINSARFAFERNDTIHVTGAGEIRNFAQ